MRSKSFLHSIVRLTTYSAQSNDSVDGSDVAKMSLTLQQSAFWTHLGFAGRASFARDRQIGNLKSNVVNDEDVQTGQKTL